MKMAIVIDNKLIIDLIHEHIVSKMGEKASPKKDAIKVQVRSKQNYREHQFENGEMQVTYEGEI